MFLGFSLTRNYVIENEKLFNAHLPGKETVIFGTEWVVSCVAASAPPLQHTRLWEQNSGNLPSMRHRENHRWLANHPRVWWELIQRSVGSCRSQQEEPKVHTPDLGGKFKSTPGRTKYKMIHTLLGPSRLCRKTVPAGQESIGTKKYHIWEEIKRNI